MLFVVIAASCSEKEETEDHNTVSIEDPDEKQAIIEKAQAAEKEIQSMWTITNLHQHYTGDSINQEITMQIHNKLMLDPLSSSTHSSMPALDYEFAMYSNEDATYFTENPNTENEDWQKLPNADHKEIIADYKNTSFINYPVLLEHIDELIVNDIEDEINDKPYYELILKGDADTIYHKLLPQNDMGGLAQTDMDDDPGETSVDEFSLSVKLEKDTGHLIEFETKMNGTAIFEGEDISISEDMTFYVEGINIYEGEDDYYLVPSELQRYMDGKD
ncbi:DUF6612 family protein [Virgibacillus sp. YIM 98842]|uniref:DUF6612 family protein n=1 Tax=Virgibacillus sp. YIM 98842 TaxID=2663533 RepID=UPI0013DC7837|nr:DUF6612 family protein [Virgibacillus sp. YIM 98842]